MLIEQKWEVPIGVSLLDCSCQCTGRSCLSWILGSLRGICFQGVFVCCSVINFPLVEGFVRVWIGLQLCFA